MKFSKIILLLFLLTAGFMLCACKKLTQVDSPQNQLTTDKIFSDSTAVLGALLNAYGFFNQSIDPVLTNNLALYADEYDYSGINQELLEFRHSALSAGNVFNLNIWANYYFVIYQCNDLISELRNDHFISPETVGIFSCEAKFLRAYAYFYLVNLYGELPLITGNDVRVTAVAARSDTEAIYRQIETDLAEARDGLPESYRGQGRVRVNRWAASALLARVYLYHRNWSNAENEATAVINSGMYSLENNIPAVFSANSAEGILQFWTQYGYVANTLNVIPGAGLIPPFILTDRLLESFEPGDARKNCWTYTLFKDKDSFCYSFKYRNTAVNTTSPEYLMGLRLGEQYLIRAEARAMQNNWQGSQSDLNKIRKRAGLPDSKATGLSATLAAILHERQVELFGEWGHRFMDLKRTGNLNAVIGSYKTTWKPAAMLFPLPQNEITYDHNLIQNPGY